MMSNELFEAALEELRDKNPNDPVLDDVDYVKQNYWDVMQCNDFDPRVAVRLCYAAYLYESKAAVRMLQKIIRVQMDGIVGNKTLQTANNNFKPEKICEEYDKMRRIAYRRIYNPGEPDKGYMDFIDQPYFNKIFSKCKDKTKWCSVFNKHIIDSTINTRLRLAHFCTQIIHESSYLNTLVENLNYSAAGLRKIFPKYFKTDAEAKKFQRNPEKIANKVYANRMGNGNEASGDGWRYRGRGLIQLTGKTNYMAFFEAMKMDTLNPDYLSTPEGAMKSAIWFWNKNGLNKLADKDDLVSITKKINGGTNGLADRKSINAVVSGITDYTKGETESQTLERALINI